MNTYTTSDGLTLVVKYISWVSTISKKDHFFNIGIVGEGEAKASQMQCRSELHAEAERNKLLDLIAGEN